MQISKPIVEFVKGVSIVLALSVILVFISHSITFSHLEETIFNQYALVRGEPFVSDGKRIVIEPFYNRILFPAVFVLFTKMFHSWTDVQAFLLLRFISFVICLSLIYLAAYRRLTVVKRDVAIVLCAVAICMIPPFAHGWVHSSDIFDLTFCLFMFLYIAEDKFLLAFFVACLTAVNRETGAFAAVAYVCFSFGNERVSLVAVKAALLGLIPYLGAVFVRKLVLGDQLSLPLESSGHWYTSLAYNLALWTGQWYTGLTYNFALWVEAFKRPSPIGWPMLLFAMMVFPWLVFLGRSSTRDFKIRGFAAFFATVAITAAIGINAEARTFIPCVALLIGCGLATTKLSHKAELFGSQNSYFR
jgi:hypothetical protein